MFTSKAKAVTSTVYQFILQVHRRIPFETYVMALFTLATIYTGPNRYYLLILIISTTAIYLYNNNLLTALWLIFIGTLLFHRGRVFPITLLYDHAWDGSYNLGYNLEVLFNDVILAAITYLLISRKRLFTSIKLPHKNLGILLLLVICLIGFTFYVTLRSPFPNTATYYFIQLIKALIFFFAAIVILKLPGVFTKTSGMITFLVIFNSLLIIAQAQHGSPLGTLIEDKSAVYGWYADENPTLYRPGGIFSDPNMAGTLIATFLPFSLYQLFKGNRITRNMFAGINLVVVFALILTASRASWLITLTTSLIVLFKWGQPAIGRIIRTLRHNNRLLIIPIVVLLILTPFMLTRITTLSDAFTESGGGTFRLTHLKIGFHYLTTSWWGNGLGTFPYLVALDYPVSITGIGPALPHNLIAQTMSEIGLGGTLTLITLIGYTAYLLYASRRQHPLVFISFLSYISFTLLAQLYPWFTNPKTIYWLWLVAAIGISRLTITHDQLH